MAYAKGCCRPDLTNLSIEQISTYEDGTLFIRQKKGTIRFTPNDAKLLSEIIPDLLKEKCDTQVIISQFAIGRSEGEEQGVYIEKRKSLPMDNEPKLDYYSRQNQMLS